MGSIKIDEKGRVRCYPFGRKGFAKKIVHKSARRIGKALAKKGR